MPEPVMSWLVAFRPRKRRRNNFFWSSLGMPMPVSCMVSVQRFLICPASIRTSPPCCVYFKALLIRLRRIDAFLFCVCLELFQIGLQILIQFVTRYKGLRTVIVLFLEIDEVISQVGQVFRVL